MKTAAMKKVDRFPLFVRDFLQSNPRGRSGWFDVAMPAQLGLNVPSANERETATDYQIELAAPGLSKQDFHIDLENRMLTIRVEKEDNKNRKSNGYIRREYSYNMFLRTFTLPHDINADLVQAKYENGLLKITIAKKGITPVTPKKEIQVS